MININILFCFCFCRFSPLLSFLEWDVRSFLRLHVLGLACYSLDSLFFFSLLEKRRQILSVYYICFLFFSSYNPLYFYLFAYLLPTVYCVHSLLKLLKLILHNYTYRNYYLNNCLMYLYHG